MGRTKRMICLAAVALICATFCVPAFGEVEGSAKYTSALQQFFVSGGVIVWFVLLPLSAVMVERNVNFALTIRR